MNGRLWAALLLAAIPASMAQAHGFATDATAKVPGAKNAKVTQVYEHRLPGVPGKSIKGVLVEYGPGGYSPPHRHARSAIIYATVLEGAVRCQLNGGEIRTYRTGENWTELPGDHHGVSANASGIRPARVLAVFVVDDADQPLTIADAQ